MDLNPLTYALLAQESYHAIPQIGEEGKAGRAILEHTVDGLAAAFPGTNNMACALADIDVARLQVAGLGELHRGFWDAFLEVRGPLLATVAIAGSPIVPCGHSEGAALAILFGAELCLAGRPPKAVFAFEPPRVSIDDTLRRLFAACGVPLFLYRTGNDIVTQLPPDLLHPWQHPAVLRPIGRPALPIDNAEDHEIARVVDAIRIVVAGS